MPESWKWTHLSTIDDVVHALTEAKHKRWLCRGQSKRYGALTPSIDRPPRDSLSRAEKLALERRSIDLFQSRYRTCKLLLEFLVHFGSFLGFYRQIGVVCCQFPDHCGGFQYLLFFFNQVFLELRITVSGIDQNVDLPVQRNKAVLHISSGTRIYGQVTICKSAIKPDLSLKGWRNTPFKIMDLIK